MTRAEPPTTGGTTGGAYPLHEGSMLAGRFFLLRRRGQGAMGEVWEAEDRELGEKVAVKLLHPGISQDPEAIARFKREIQLARKVTHPNVCRSHDLLRHDHEGSCLYFLTLELLEGETLAQRLKRKPVLEETEVRGIVQDIVSGLAAAHRVGVIHRDLKSSNIFLAEGTNAERAVLTDFGLAWTPASPNAELLTPTGHMVGSPAYMAPEQIRGEALSPATDLYSLGILIFEMLTGKLPFQGTTALYTALKRLHEPPPRIGDFRADLNPVWDRIVEYCLRRDPEEPTREAATVAAMLESGDGEESPGLPPDNPLQDISKPRSKPWRSNLILSAGAVLILLLLVAWTLYPFSHRRSGSPEPLLPTDPASAQILRSALEALSRGEPGAVLAALSPESGIEEESALALALKAWAFSAVGDLSQGRAAARKARADSSALPAEWRLRLEATMAEMAYDWAGAADLYHRLAQRYPGTAKYRLDELRTRVEGNLLPSALTKPASAKPASAKPASARYSGEIQAEDLPPQLRSQLLTTRAQRAGLEGNFEEQRRLGTEAASAAQRRGHRFGEGRARLQAAWGYLGLADRPRAASEARRARSLAEEAEDPRGRIRADRILGRIDAREGRIAEARKRLTEARLACRKLGDERCQGRLLSDLATLDFLNRDLVAAESSYREARALLDGSADRGSRAEVDQNLGLLAARSGDPKGAELYYRNALSTFQEIGRRQDLSLTLLALGSLHQDSGRTSEAAESYLQAAQGFRASGNSEDLARALFGSGSLSLQLGEYPAAEAFFVEAWEAAIGVGSPKLEGESLLGQCSARRRQGQLLQALELCARGREKMSFARRGLNPYFRIEQALVLGLMGRGDEALGELTPLLELEARPRPRSPWVAGWLARGRLLSLQGLKKPAEQAFQRAESLLGPSGASHFRTEIRLWRVLSALRSADPETTRAALSAALAEARREGDTSAEARAMAGLAEVETLFGSLEAARRLRKEALALHLSLGETLETAQDRLALAEAALREGDSKGAAELTEAALFELQGTGATPLIRRAEALRGRLMGDQGPPKV